jgi:hypothetical protein
MEIVTNPKEQVIGEEKQSTGNTQQTKFGV